uniref:Uncharacterized protein n=1 Tax=Lactuca sativa TaxID=4236 RepID=A0A9R1XIG7_LACSA|nr:hypothetical protein LSAT_V11C400185520 [Lactuca sativa]
MFSIISFFSFHLYMYKVVLPHVEHIKCARHVYANFRKVFSGIEFKNMFWTVAKSTVEGDFELNMEKIREVIRVAYDHLMARGPKSWCRSFFIGGMACEVHQLVESLFFHLFPTPTLLVESSKNSTSSPSSITSGLSSSDSPSSSLNSSSSSSSYECG